MPGCVRDEDLHRFHARELGGEEQTALLQHLQTCSRCSARDAELVFEHHRLIELMHGLREAGRDAQGPVPSHPAGPPLDALGPVFEAVEIPGYELLSEIHRGGQGVVWRAVQRNTGKQVAVKIMREGPFAGPRDRARFEREVQVLAQLRHPSIVTIHDSGTAGGCFYFVMDCIEGRRLDEYLDGRSVETEEILKLFEAICEAVNTAHLGGIIHRDLKPGNILIDAAGRPHILDFGLAKTNGPASGAASSEAMTMTGVFLGTLNWASPEQADGLPGRTDVRTDVYSIGVMLYHALTGQFPYPVTGGMREVLDHILTTFPAPPSNVAPARRGINYEVDTIVLKCLSKGRDRRYQNAGEVARDLGHYLSGEPIEAKRDSALYVLRKTIGQHKAIASLSTLLVLSLAALTVVMTLQSAHLARERDRSLGAEKVAATERDQAQAAKARADQESESLRRALYAHRLTAACSAYDHCLATQMIDVLNECSPDLRSWEWYRLRWLSDRSSSTARQPSRISALAVTPDRKLLAGMTDGSIVCWEIAAWNSVWKLPGHGSAVSGIAISLDGSHFASGLKNDCLRLHDLGTGRVIREIPIPSESQLLTFLPDGRSVVCSTGQATGVGIIWDLEGGKKVGAVTGRSGSALLGVSPDGQLLVFGDPGGRLSVREVSTGNEILLLEGHRRKVNALCFSPDGRRLVSGGADKRAVIWDLQTGAALRTLEGHFREVHDVAVRADGRVATLANDQALRLWDADTGRLTRTFRGGAERIRFVPGSTWIVSSCQDTLKLWDEAADEDTLVWMNPRLGPVGSCSFSPDGERIAAPTSNGTVRVLDARLLGSPLMTLGGHQGAVQVAAFSPDGRKLLSAGDDKTLRIWDAGTGRELMKLLGHSDGIPDARFSPDGHRIVTGSWDRTCKVWDVGSGACLATLKQADEVWQTAISPDGRRIASGGMNARVYLWNAETAELLRTLDGHTAQIDALAFSPDGRYLVSGGFDATLRVWAADTGECLAVMSSKIAENIYDVTFTPDGKRLVSGGVAFVEVWQPWTAEKVFSFQAHEYSIYCTTFSRDGTRLLTAGAEGTLKVWPSLKPADGGKK